jgi:O-acetyl-ADP-ribose deacetylase (regulator of RNase III)
MEVASEHGIKSIAFPSISTGIFNYPNKEAAEIALKTVIRELERFSDIQQVIFVLRPKALKLYKKTLNML